jgi:hypothetical protein
VTRLPVTATFWSSAREELGPAAASFSTAFGVMTTLVSPHWRTIDVLLRMTQSLLTEVELDP